MKIIGTCLNESVHKYYWIVEYKDSDDRLFYNLYPLELGLDELKKLPYSGYYNLQSLYKLKNITVAWINE